MDRQRLADAARERRLALGLRQDEVAERAGMSRRTVIKIEGAEPVKPRSLWLLDPALEWVPGGAERCLMLGEHPVEVGRTAPPPDRLLPLDDDERQIWGLVHLPEATRVELIDIKRRRQREARERPTKAAQNVA